eukprot:CAMPEP_0172442988 /NCGR_PEP_ID=MMETSP1065-20121228/3306_1 /TAXON_ID=265537 /ORGANISM="Amphiprora paludosa, Strain CCMP125" /LENGTH=116 /DNA_ID=CAMNT_0013193041 /DNA_START=304 /DNA_END=654 /DNA_ORIENTATION=-
MMLNPKDLSVLEQLVIMKEEERRKVQERRARLGIDKFAQKQRANALAQFRSTSVDSASTRTRTRTKTSKDAVRSIPADNDARPWSRQSSNKVNKGTISSTSSAASTATIHQEEDEY